MQMNRASRKQGRSLKSFFQQLADQHEIHGHMVIPEPSCHSLSATYVHKHWFLVSQHFEPAICLPYAELNWWMDYAIDPCSRHGESPGVKKLFSDEKKLSRRIDRFMDTTYLGFLKKRLIYTNTSDFCEVSEYFPREEINTLFRKEIEKLLLRTQHLSSDLQKELKMLKERDWVAYIDRSLRRAGFKDHDLDQLVQDLTVKMLVTGNLFSGWRGESSLQARFLVTLRNAIATLVKKKQASSKRSHELPVDAPSRRVQTTESLVDDFRDYLRTELGPAAVTVLDQRLVGGDTKELIGQQGIESSYRLKRMVQEIKEAARRFAVGNAEFHHMVTRAFEKEAQTMERRFNRVGV
jgi:hypothetical protein